MARTVKTVKKNSSVKRTAKKKHHHVEVKHVSRKSHLGEKINRWCEQSMLNAITEYKQQNELPTNDKLTLRALARAHNVPFESFRRRVKGKLSAAVTDPATGNSSVHLHQLGKKTILRYEAEHELAQHIKDLAAVGFPCSRDDIRCLAYEYALHNNITGFSDKKKKAGYDWFDGFMGQFPQLAIKSAENLSGPRAMSMNPTQVKQWFEKYDEILQRLGIRDCPRFIWNFDETGVQNIHCATEVVGQVGIPTYNITAMEKGETSTALVGINAVGEASPPMIIHRGKNVGKGWSNGLMEHLMEHW
jgi:hypothetical protein